MRKIAQPKNKQEFQMYSDFSFESSYLDNEPKNELSLTRKEALFIDDSLTMLMENEPGDLPLTSIRPLIHNASIPAPIDLIEKIGMAILYLTDDKNSGSEIIITVSDTDLYMLREISLSYIRVGTEPVGYNLKLKIYRLLLNSKYEREKIARTLLSQIDE